MAQSRPIFRSNAILSHIINRAQQTRSFSSVPSSKLLNINTLNKKVLKAEYAVRGRLVILAEQLKEKLAKPNHGLPFKEVIFCNIGNPQSLGQQPITFYRQVLSLCINPSLLTPSQISTTQKLYPSDAIARAQTILKETPGGLGAYSHSKGLKAVREQVKQYIETRDGGIASDSENIFLSNGASEAIAHIMRLILASEKDGILIPIPQYPLYTATLSLLGGQGIGYVLDESKEWSCTREDLDKTLKQATSKGVVPKAMVVINPGNPTGQVLSEANMRDVITFCRDNKLVLLSDEVYQTNIYRADKPFHSFKKVLFSMGPKFSSQVELMSFHSTSKGFLGECGFRGGYCEVTNMDEEIKEQYYKLVSISLCPNLPGQVMTGLMVNPPKLGDPSYTLFAQERDAVLGSLKRRAQKVVAGLNAMPGITCNNADGAMYVFPRVHLPQKAVKAAEQKGLVADVFYAEELLNSTGICIVPGSGFGQADGTWHFRSTFLPAEDKIDSVIALMSTFHKEFMKKYS